MQMEKDELINKSEKVLQIDIPAGAMEKARTFIERAREYHRTIGDNFIGHACGCTPGGSTVWWLGYTSSEYRDVTDKLFDEIFAEELAEIAADEDRQRMHALAQIFGTDRETEPCVCPFSLR